MHNRRTRVTFSMLLFSVFLLCGLLLQGCGGTAPSSGGTNGPITITVAYQRFGPPPYLEENWWLKTKQQVEASNPNIKIKLEPIVADEGGYYTKIDLMMRSPNTAPDIVREDSFLVSSDVTAGYLAPLDKYLANWPEYQQWFPSMQQITTFDGHNYGIMSSTDARLIWFNKDIFKQAGLPTDWQPTTWADILSAARAVKEKVPGVIPLNLYSGVPMDEASTMQGFEMLLYGTKDPLYNYQSKKWVVSSKGFQDALDFVKQVYDPKNLLGPTNDIALSTQANNIVQQQLMPKGKVAINIDGSWISRTWIPGGTTPWPAWKDTIGVAKMPTQSGQDPKYVSLSGGWAYSISALSPHKDQAFEILKVLNAKDSLAAHVVDLRGIAARKDVAEVPAYQALPYYDYFNSIMTYSQFRPAFPAYPKISVQIDSAMQHVMSGQSPSDAMASFAQAVTGIAGTDNVETHT